MISEANERILVACVGNIFLGDDAFGVEMARELRSAHLPSEAVVRDYGIRGIDLAYALLEPWRAVIIVDAVARGGAPGSLYLLEVEGDQRDGTALDPHSIDIAQVFALGRSLGEISAPVYVLGCEPGLLDDNFDGVAGLSPSVSAMLPEATRILEQWIHSLISPAVMIGCVRTAANE